MDLGEAIETSAAGVGLLDALVEACMSRARERGVSQVGRALLVDLRIRSEVCRRVHARAQAGTEYEVAIAAAMLGESLATVAQAAAHRFGDPLDDSSTIDRLARDAARLARRLEPERARTRVAASLLGFEGSAVR